MDRTKGIGGTDIAAIIGLNPWKSAIDVYMEKLGLVEDQPDNESMWWGREMEPVLEKRYTKETNLYVSSFSNCHVLTSIQEKFPWFVGTPDGIIFGEEKIVGGVDYKTTGYSKKGEWGEPGTDEVPPYYHTQAMWYMGLTGAQWWDIAVLFMGARREFRIYRIVRDDELIASLIEKGKDFWENHVIPQISPPVDAAPGWDKYFKAKYPREEDDIVEVRDDSVGNYKRLKEQVRIDTDAMNLFENRIKEMLGSHAGLTSPWGKITWKKSKDREATDWQKAFEYLWSIREWDGASYGHKDDLLKEYTTTKPGPRIFRTYFNKEDE